MTYVRTCVRSMGTRFCAYVRSPSATGSNKTRIHSSTQQITIYMHALRVYDTYATYTLSESGISSRGAMQCASYVALVVLWIQSRACVAGHGRQGTCDDVGCRCAVHQKSTTGVRCKWWKLGLDAVVVDSGCTARAEPRQAQEQVISTPIYPYMLLVPELALAQPLRCVHIHCTTTASNPNFHHLHRTPAALFWCTA